MYHTFLRHRNRTVLLLVSLLFLASCQKDRSLGEQIALQELVSENLQIELNPNGNTPLAARLSFTADVPVQVSYTIEGEEPISHTFPGFSATQRVPILGLYPDTDNEVKVTISDQAGNFASATLHVETGPLPDYFPAIETNVNTSLRQEGWTLTEIGIGLGEAFMSVPSIIDASGNVRWYIVLDAYTDLCFPIKQKSNGNLLISFYEHIYEYTMLGGVVNDIYLPGWYQHHETREMPNGNLLVSVDKIGESTVEDHILEVTPSGSIVQVWDMRPILDMDRYDLVEDEVDWFHNNAVYYSEADDCLLVSGRNQGVVKVNRNNEIVWILSPHQGWGTATNGTNTQDFLLTAIDANGDPYPEEVQQGTAPADDFDWCWGQHACMLLPNGNIFLFDNGFNRQFIAGVPSYSRGVEYRINEENMTVQEIWQYGKERGPECWAPIISDVDVLDNTNRLITSGIVFGAEPYAKIMEVSYPDRTVVYEITLHFKNLLAAGGLAWGGLDLNYRAERIHIFPQ